MGVREHADRDCWCDPIYLRQCNECDGRGEDTDGRKKACWACKGAGVLRCDKAHDQAFSLHMEFEFEGDDE